jgi:EAL domain-containing protein (putative c-di-GMP-specific phosphodiesterase class I)
LNLRVVAEGVEKSEQLEFLRANGCGEVQGYFFAYPMPAEEFAAMFDRGVAV